MASIQRRGERWRVQVRRHGLPPLSKTFDKHEEARRWAHKLEGRIAADDFVDLSEARQTSLGEALDRYLIEVTPAKKGAKQERNRIKAWLRDPLADRPLASVRSMDIAAWRNERVVAGKTPTTIKNALMIISQVYQLAATEWGHAGAAKPGAGRAHAAEQAGVNRHGIGTPDRLAKGTPLRVMREGAGEVGAEP